MAWRVLQLSKDHFSSSAKAFLCFKYKKGISDLITVFFFDSTVIFSICMFALSFQAFPKRKIAPEILLVFVLKFFPFFYNLSGYFHVCVSKCSVFSIHMDSSDLLRHGSSAPSVAYTPCCGQHLVHWTHGKAETSGSVAECASLTARILLTIFIFFASIYFTRMAR